MEEEDDNRVAANAEIRFIALELTKLAQKSGRKFDDVAAEYMRNAEKLAEMVAGSSQAPARRARRASSKGR